VLSRTSGVQLHPTSLPSGTLGRDAYKFVDWLEAAGQTWWQMLPLGPPDRYGSPYKSASAFAGSPQLLEKPNAPVSKSEELDFVEAQGFWASDWKKFGPRGAVADQVRFQREWTALRSYANDRGVRLMGDIAIYVAPGSADHRAHPDLFQDGFVAGVPPDAYSDTGQLWGNPLYDWPSLRRRRYGWWTERLRRTFEMFDLARIDHFRGFVAYWAVPEADSDARAGSWKRGPGRALFEHAASALDLPVDGLPLLAEDLGVITPPVDRLRQSLDLPGMRVLQFGFDPSDPRGPHRPENLVEDVAVYTATHDSDTAIGWYESLPAERRAEVDMELSRRGIGERAIQWALIRLAWESPARMAMTQAQDVLGLGSEGRMNVPGTKGGSWKWRAEAGAFKPVMAKQLRAITEAAGRLLS
jgi:4-alpha-glucanotransferase